MRYLELPGELKYFINGATTEHEDGSISVDGHVRWGWERLAVIPIKFRQVSGDFECHCNFLTSLENAPDFVGGSFYCRHNKLTSLDGLGEVRGKIVCDSNPAPEEELLADYRRKRAKIELVAGS